MARLFSRDLPPAFVDGQRIAPPFTQFDDFDTPTIGTLASTTAAALVSSATNVKPWLMVNTGGTPTGGLPAAFHGGIIEDENGYAAFWTDGDDNDECIIKRHRSCWRPRQDLVIVYGARFRAADVSACETLIGLGAVDADNEPIPALADFIAFGIGSNGNIKAACGKNSSGGTLAIEATAGTTTFDSGLAAADNEWVEVTATVYGTQRVTFAVNGIVVGTASTNIPDDVNLAQFASIRNKGGGEEQMNVDYILTTRERYYA